MADAFGEFYKDLKETEKKDAKLTPKQQIERLLKPGSTYRNLNPYEVLQVDPDLDIAEIRKKYRRMSILVHPDKNQDDIERAQAAFDALKKAFTLLEDEKTRKKCYELVEEARGRTSMNMEEKRKKKRKEAIAKGLPPSGENIRIEEDDKDAYAKAVNILTMKLFADLERKRRDMENRISEDAARKADAEQKAEERKNKEVEFAKNWEESRQGRVNSWLNFTGKKPHHKDEKAPEKAKPKVPAAQPAPPLPPPLPQGAPPPPPAPGQSFSRPPPPPPMKKFVPQVSAPPPPDLPPGVQPPIRMNFPPPELPPGAYNAPTYGGPSTYGAAASTTSSYYSSHTVPKPAPPPFKAEKKKKKEKKFNPMGFRPPKHKPESR